MSFDTAIFIVCILVINAFIFAAIRSPRICAIIFGTLLAVPYFLLGYVYDGLPQYPQPHRIIGFCNYVPRIYIYTRTIQICVLVLAYKTYVHTLLRNYCF
jgi:hypothetical protein